MSPTPAAWTTAAAATLRQEQKMTDPMTSAERPTQEVAPRTAAGDEAHQRSHAISKWGCPAKRGEVCIIALNIAQAEDQAAEASRSAPPPAAQPSASSEGDARCQCGHTRAEHDSRYDAPNHCTHRCVPPWIAAKPTGSADEPLLRAAIRDALHSTPHWRLTGTTDLDRFSEIIARKARAALASAEPAEVDG